MTTATAKTSATMIFCPFGTITRAYVWKGAWLDYDTLHGRDYNAWLGEEQNAFGVLMNAVKMYGGWFARNKFIAYSVNIATLEKAFSIHPGDLACMRIYLPTVQEVKEATAEWNDKVERHVKKVISRVEALLKKHGSMITKANVLKVETGERYFWSEVNDNIRVQAEALRDARYSQVPKIPYIAVPVTTDISAPYYDDLDPLYELKTLSIYDGGMCTDTSLSGYYFRNSEVVEMQDDNRLSIYSSVHPDRPKRG